MTRGGLAPNVDDDVRLPQLIPLFDNSKLAAPAVKAQGDCEPSPSLSLSLSLSLPLSLSLSPSPSLCVKMYVCVCVLLGLVPPLAPGFELVPLISLVMQRSRSAYSLVDC